MLSHRNLTGCALSQSAALPMAADDVSLHALPMFHVGAISGLLVGIMGGGGHSFLARFDPVDFPEFSRIFSEYLQDQWCRAA